ncbi:hypothetical protein PVAP13_4NG269800 [Panicum virgatum]|uniref:Uncharacterized protein n=1 Tax=Panicum virgatum TaxID=38727 RepID=A0A8T0TDK9_PANVG|nr:hypothetical protein PVAP13_4NG269800 [Panicum virgatum]
MLAAAAESAVTTAKSAAAVTDSAAAADSRPRSSSPAGSSSHGRRGRDPHGRRGRALLPHACGVKLPTAGWVELCSHGRPRTTASTTTSVPEDRCVTAGGGRGPCGEAAGDGRRRRRTRVGREAAEGPEGRTRSRRTAPGTSRRSCARGQGTRARCRCQRLGMARVPRCGWCWKRGPTGRLAVAVARVDDSGARWPGPQQVKESTTLEILLVCWILIYGKAK